MDLITTLGLGPREHMAIVGAGGKTSLMFALAEDLFIGGKRVVIGTTTKVWTMEAMRFPCVIFSRFDSTWHEKVRDALERYGHIFIGHGILDSGKLEGIGPALADLLYKGPTMDYLILEADGAAGRPVKAPAPHEPVIPASATVVVAMIGLEVIEKDLDPAFVFRLNRFKEVTGLASGEKISPEVLTTIFHSPEGLFKGAPISARRVAFLNKLDLLRDDLKARRLADLILRPSGVLIDRVVIGSIKEKRYAIVD